MDDRYSSESSVSDEQSNNESSSDSYCYDSDGSYQYSYNIGNVTYSKKKFKKILDSDDPADKEKVKSLIVDCIKEDNFEALDSILCRSKFNIDDILITEKGQTAIHVAYYHDMQNLMEVIFDNMIHKQINSTDCNGLTHLHIGCWANHEDLIKECLENNADVNACFSETDSRGNLISGITPLHLASMSSSETVKVLLEKGSDIHAVNSVGKSSLHLACSNYGYPHDGSDPNHVYENVEIMNVLLDYGCDLNVRDSNGNTPLLSIYRDSYISNLWMGYGIPVAETMKKLKLLLERNADVTVTNNDGDTVLHRLIRMLMCANYMKSDYIRCRFNTAIHIKMVEMILNAGQSVDVNAKNSLGETPLQLAVSLMSASITKILLDHGAGMSSLTFSHNDEYCFGYSYEVPRLKQVYNVVNIMDILLDRGFELSLEENLMVMKFLIHDVKKCECENVFLSNDDIHSYCRNDSVEFIFKRLMAFSSFKHFKQVLIKVMKSLSAANFKEGKSNMLFHVKELFSYNDIAGFFIEKNIRSLFSKIKIQVKMREWHIKDIKKEIACMKTIKLVDEITLYDIISKHPHDIYKYIKNINFQDMELSKKFNHFEYMVEGHIAKSLTRYYVESSAYHYLRELSFKSLPVLCLQRILYCLSNEEILNLCLAAVNGCQN